jgi:glycine oxidase
MTLYTDRTVAPGERLKPPAEFHGGAGAAPTLPAQADVAVIGAGVIGLSIAWRLMSRGLSVAVFDRAEAGSGTS